MVAGPGIEPGTPRFSVSCSTNWAIQPNGGGGGTWTLTELPPQDFKSCVSTIPPLPLKWLPGLDSNQRIHESKSCVLPLDYPAINGKFLFHWEELHRKKLVKYFTYIITKILLLSNQWQGHKDLNPDRRFWRPVSYHWTMPLYKVSLQFNFGFSHLSAPLLSTWAFGSSAN